MPPALVNHSLVQLAVMQHFGALMRLLLGMLLLGLLLSGLPKAANAQFPFQIPGLGGFGGSGNSGGSSNRGNFDIRNLVDNLGKAAREPNEEEERRIGQDFAETLLGAKPLHRDTRLQRYVNALGRWLTLHTERPDLAWSFAVLDDNGFNAFATPGGFIFVTHGLVRRMRNEAELAGVLAHEIAHVLRKHHLAAVQANARTGVLGDVLAAATRDRSAQTQNMLVNLGRQLYARGLDKDDEYEADRLGVVIAARAGYDPYGLPGVLQMLESQNANSIEFSLLFNTHPSPTSRLEALERVMGTSLDRFSGAPEKTIEQRLVEFTR